MENEAIKYFVCKQLDEIKRLLKNGNSNEAREYFHELCGGIYFMLYNDDITEEMFQSLCDFTMKVLKLIQKYD